MVKYDNNTDINIKYANIIKNIREELEEVSNKVLLENIPYRSKEENNNLKLKLKKQIEKCCDIKSYKISKLKLPRKLKKKFKKQSCYSYKIDVLLNGDI